MQWKNTNQKTKTKTKNPQQATVLKQHNDLKFIGDVVVLADIYHLYLPNVDKVLWKLLQGSPAWAEGMGVGEEGEYCWSPER